MRDVKVLLAVVVLLVGGSAVLFVFDPLDPSEEGRFHPDHTKVFNEFQDAVSAFVGGDGVSSVPPDSECKQTDDDSWRCYRRWAPVGHPEAAEVLEANVEVYEDRVVVGQISRTPDPEGGNR